VRAPQWQFTVCTTFFIYQFFSMPGLIPIIDSRIVFIARGIERTELEDSFI
jgi:hypothetical protein